MKFTKPTTTYWDNKLAAYFHDPIDKVFQIKGHEERGEKILQEAFGLQKPNDDFWEIADSIASGFERGIIPSYSEDKNKSGAIDFIKNPILTHPIGSKNQIEIKLPEGITQVKIFEELLNNLKNDIGDKPEKAGFSNRFHNDPDGFAFARFLYTHLRLRFTLAEKNVAKLGALWHRIPADSRFPDHSIWQHNGLVSALNSSLELCGNSIENIGLMVISITPVQNFIAKARKLRDYWAGSVILSYLAFEGIRWVIENLGCDHILYPSLVDQPLVNEYMKKKWQINENDMLEQAKDIASFPNKFLFLIPLNKVNEISSDIKETINNKWNELGKLVCNDLLNKIGIPTDESEIIKKYFTEQFENYWDINWSAVKLLNKNNQNDIKELLPEKSYKNNIETINIFNEIIKDKEHYDKSGLGLMYSVSHSLVQTALATTKTTRIIKRKEQNGEKCQICGEFEVLNTFIYKDGEKASKYEKNIKELWKKIKNEYGEFDFTENERLCSICLTKRLAGKILKENNNHILNKTFSEFEGFPSTTYIALYDNKKFKNCDNKIEFAQNLHDNKDELHIDNRDRYYAILMMDGDKMGDLVNGETLASTWESIIHPEMKKRLEDPDFEGKYRINWNKIFKNTPKRVLTPSIHSSISESLGDFSIYGAARIVKKYDGKLIYAGGDDVCAIMPVSTVLQAAKEMKDYYNSYFRIITKDKSEIFNGNLEVGKLSVNLGVGDKISISAGVLICHHKEPLSFMIEKAQKLLKEKAKKESGRNAIAIELKKRSGSSRYFTDKWNSERFKIFCEIGKKIGNKNIREISKSLVYRLNRYKDGFEAMLKKQNYDELITNFIKAQLDKSGIKSNNKEEIAKYIKILGIIDKNGNKEFNIESLIIAGFIEEKGE